MLEDYTALSLITNKGLRIIVCGGREYCERAKVFKALDAVHGKRPIGVVIQGGAAGADLLAKEWAEARGVRCDEYQADWKQHGKRAGPMRNQLMASLGADGCVAFPGGVGTLDMTTRAEAQGIPVWRPFG